MLGELSWLPGYLKEAIQDPGEDLEPLLNTVLVFARVRTSTLQNMRSWQKVSRLAKKLNKAAEAVGTTSHKIELVRRGPKTFFVTCSNSPRFNWNLSLTHHDVGKNLDYFAAGHVQSEPISAECTVYYLEKTTFEELLGERVFIDYLKDDTKGDLFTYNLQRETLFNSTMKNLALDYRFKCLTLWPDTLQSIPSIMAQTNPPSTQWWDDNCFFINFGLPGILLHTKFAFYGWETNYSRYWPLIQETFEFMLKYKRHDYWYTSSETGTAFWDSMENTFRQVKTIGEGNLDPTTTEFQEAYAKIREQFDGLSKIVDDSSIACTTKAPVRQRRPHASNLFSRLAYKVLFVRETLSLQVFHRNRLSPRIQSEGIEYPTSGDEDAFQWFK